MVVACPPPFSVRTFMSVHTRSGVLSNSARVLAFAAPPPLADAAMDVLRQRLDVSLSEHSGSKHTCFAGDMFRHRPPFEEILNFKGWAEKRQEDITKLMGRKVCPVDWLSFYIDCEGVWMLATSKSEQSVNNMRQALSTILVALPKDQRRTVEDSVRPLDELDADRFGRWNNVEDLRPKVRPRQCKPDLLGTKNLTRNNLTAPRPGDDAQLSIEPPKRARTLAEFLEQNDWTEEEESEEEGGGGDATSPQALTLNGSATMNWEAALAVWTDPSQSMSSRSIWTPWTTWVVRAQTQATIVIASAGIAPKLTYIRCHREGRRHQLLVQKLREEYAAPGMPQAVQMAAQLARNGALPGHGGPRGRKSEFLRRCVDAVKEIKPSAETDITRLPEAGQAAIRRALGQEEVPYDGCLTESCLDEETTWDTRDLSMPGEKPMPFSRCSRCGRPQSFGRKIRDLNGMMRPTLKRERALLLPQALPYVKRLPMSWKEGAAAVDAEEARAEKRERRD